MITLDELIHHHNLILNYHVPPNSYNPHDIAFATFTYLTAYRTLRQQLASISDHVDINISGIDLKRILGDQP